MDSRLRGNDELMVIDESPQALNRPRHFSFDFMVQHLGPRALRPVAIGAFFKRLFALTRQFADTFLALAQFAAAITVSFVLTGGSPVGGLAHGLHRRRHH